jgi:hypothetical protein
MPIAGSSASSSTNSIAFAARSRRAAACGWDQSHLAQQSDDFRWRGQRHLFPGTGWVGSGDTQFGQQVDLGGLGQLGADLGQPGIDPFAFLPTPRPR